MQLFLKFDYKTNETNDIFSTARCSMTSCFFAIIDYLYIMLIFKIYPCEINPAKMKKYLTLIFILISLSAVSFSQKEDETITMNATSDFSLALREGTAPNRLPYNPYHVEKEWNALAGDDLNHAFHMASAEGSFKGKQGIYTVTLKTLTERDGECAYNVYVNDRPIGQCQKNPPTNEFCAPAMLQWTGVEIPTGAKIRVESNSYSNLRRPEGGFFEYARGRWTGIEFKPENINNSPSGKVLNPNDFTKCVSVGNPAASAEMKFDTPAQSYYIISAGEGLKDRNDSFGYLFKTVDGDFILESGIRLLGLEPGAYGSSGIMFRNSIDPDAAFVACFIQSDGLTKLKYRAVKGETAKELVFKVPQAEMILIEKKADNYIVKAAKFGEIYEQISVQISENEGSSLIGFFVGSGSVGKKEATAFSNIRYFNTIK
jgi:hypothetical protein